MNYRFIIPCKNMTLEEKIIETIISQFLEGKRLWDEKTKDIQINKQWVKWVNVYKIATAINKTPSETIAILQTMEQKGKVQSKKSINQYFYACNIPGYRQHKTEKDYYTLEL